MSKQVKETPWFREQIRNFGRDGKTPAHLRNATSLTRFGFINFDNRQLKRFGNVKARARDAAVLNMPGMGDADAGKLPFPNRARGTYISPVGYGGNKRGAKKSLSLREQEARNPTDDASEYKQKRVMEEREELNAVYS